MQKPKLPGIAIEETPEPQIDILGKPEHYTVPSEELKVQSNIVNEDAVPDV